MEKIVEVLNKLDSNGWLKKERCMKLKRLHTKLGNRESTNEKEIDDIEQYM